MKLWMKKDHGSSLGLVLIFVTIAGMWLGAILLLLQVTSNGPSLTNNDAAAAAKVTAGVLDQLKKDPTIGSAAVSPTECTGLTTAVTSGYTVTCVPVSPSGNSGSPAGVVTTGTGANPGVDFGTTVTGPLTFDNGLTSTGPITVDPAAFVPVVTPNTPTCATNPLLCTSTPPVVTNCTTHNVTYAANGGSGTLPTQAAVCEGDTFVVATNALTKSGNNSNHWFDGSKAVLGGASYLMGTSDVTLTAQWVSTSCTKYSVTYAANGGSGTLPTQASLCATVPFTVQANVLTKSSNTANDWNDGTVAVYAPDTYTMPAKNVTLTAQWVSSSCTTQAVTYAANGGSGTIPTQSSLCATQTFIVAANHLKKSGNRANNWSDGSKAVNGGSRYVMPSTSVTLTAQWTVSNDGDTSGCSSDRSNKGANSGKKNSDSSTNSYYAGNGASGNSWNNNTDSKSNSWNNNKYFTTGSSSSAWSGADNYSGFSYGQDGSQYITDHCGDQGGDGSSEGDHAHHRYGDNDCDIRGTSCTEEDESDNVSSHTAQTVTSKCTSGAVTIALTAGDYDSTDIIELNKFLSPTGFTSSTTYSTTSGSGCKPSSSTVTVTLGDGEYQFSGSTALVLNNALALVKNANATMNGRTCTYTGGVSTMPKSTNGKSAGVLQSQLHGVVVNMAVDLTITAGEWDLCGLNNPTGLNYAFKNATPTQGDLVTSREGSTFRPVTSSTYNTLTVGPNGTFRIVGAVDAQWTSFQWTQNPTKPSFITQEAIFKAAHLTTTAASSYSVPFGPGSGREVQITLINTKTGVKKSMIVFIDDVNGASVGKSVRILSSTL